MPEDTPIPVKTAPAPVVCQRVRGSQPGSWRRIKISGDELSGPLPHIAQSVDRYFVDAPEKKPTVHVLKADHFSSVLQIQTNGRDIIIKKELARSRLEFLTKGIRKSRAAKAWEMGRLLIGKNLETAESLALVEDYFLFFRTNSFFICSYIPGTLLRTYLDDPDITETDKKRAAKKTIEMIHCWHRTGVTHGDPKASNIIIHNDKLFLIDPENATVRPPGKASRRAIARDWAIVLHNWQKQPHIRQIALGQILGFFDTGRHCFATRLIKKFWKDEYASAEWEKRQSAKWLQLIKELSVGTPLPDWERKAAPAGCIHAVSPKIETHCLISPRAFRWAQQEDNYFKKRRLPRQGVLAMALSLRICGFHLPSIAAGGLYGKHEYLIFTGINQESFLRLWDNTRSDPVEKKQILSCLGAETGRLHAMGFIHGDLSLNTVTMEKTADNYKVIFLPTCRTRRQRRLSARQADKDWQPLKSELAALMSPESMAIVAVAYEKAFRRR